MRSTTAVRETGPVPKKTTDRVPGPDDWAAARIRHERELRGWSTTELARRVTEAGVFLRQQQVWQIESGDPPRKLSVGEAATIAKVLDLTIGDLLTPPDTVATRNLIELGIAFAEWRRDAGLLATRLREIDERAAQLITGEDEQFMAETVVKFSGFSGLSDLIAGEFESIARAYADLAREVRGKNSVWSLIASMREMVAPGTTEYADYPDRSAATRNTEGKNPTRSVEADDDE
ncbi:MAG TPA: helix-turn-helix transcriptional regulator [Streptosporangiaceae bacterium]|nr:helix-turn-helix transcriptional regulator [Streptosporangiaceae bacterium]